MRWLAPGALVCLLCSVVDAAPDPAAAAEAARAGEQLGTQGDYVGAAAMFREAHRLDPKPAFLCNIGVAYNNAGELPRAHLFLAECVRTATLASELLEPLRAAIAAIETQLRAGELVLVQIVVEPATAQITLDGFDARGGDETFIGGREIWVMAGTHNLRVSATGFVSRDQKLEASARATVPVKVVLEPAAKPLPVRPVIAPTTTTRSGSRVAPIVATVATGVVAIAATVVYVQARGLAEDTGSPELTMPEYDDLVDRARSRQKLSWVLAGAAGAGAIVSSYLWYRARTRVEVSATADGASVAFVHRW